MSSSSFYSQQCVGILGLFLVLIIIVYFLLHHVVERFRQEDPKLDAIRLRIRSLRPNIVDGCAFYEDQKSYTINKKKIYLCLRDENGDYYHDNMLTFVALHELAHVICDEIGHTPKFQSIFQQLLTEAQIAGFYDPSIEPVQNYCEY